MPELPEVETVTRGLNFAIKNLIVKKVHVNRYDLRIKVSKNITSVLNNLKVIKVKRRAKYGVIDLENEYSIIFHLGMSGSIVIDRNNKISLKKHDHIAIDFFKNNSKKFGVRFLFRDPRRFGFFNIYKRNSPEYNKIFKFLGPEPLAANFSVQNLFYNINKRHSNIKSILLNQSIIAGLGNIYVCEALFLAAISPKTIGSNLTYSKIEELYGKIKEVLLKAIKEGGTSIQDHKNISGEIGYFQNYLSVYNREREKCNKCTTLISRFKQNGRSTYYCQKCQK
ncbi:MAG: DNA-formamidopyrimidine glycosylase [Pelagibacterales bacterium]|nr:DNA-formamidopyrimidine glycosylase [Pelagibacterales bacterium]PPR15987.1 MAG: Formamidopyrimidine-DNA glycosylase [Alphaproteobacteria bacterium MarineAlpha9_Bin3]|tara:strand:+ start:12683 stop:13525 length:843 start_codon:yes stop_codon:yes gene_type:complete